MIKFEWSILPEHVERTRRLVESKNDDPFVKARRGRNLAVEKPPITRDEFWTQMVACVLTSQQKGGPNDPVPRFIRQAPNPLTLDRCETQPYLAAYAAQTFCDFGGIRFANKPGKFLGENLSSVQGDTCQEISDALELVRTLQTLQSERSAAKLVARELQGVGPKQARNILQCLGLTRYVIPIDSRFAKWMAEMGAIISLEYLSNSDYYCCVEDGILTLCREASLPPDVLFPCVLDAAMYVSSDGDTWTDAAVAGYY